MKTIIDRSECRALSDHIEGKLVVIKPEFFKPQFREAKYQLVLATGGFGCDADAHIKSDLRLVAGGGYNSEHIHNVKFKIEAI